MRIENQRCALFLVIAGDCMGIFKEIETNAGNW